MIHTFPLPKSYQFIPSGNCSSRKCHSCDKEVGMAPWLSLYYERTEEIYCSKCCKKRIETLIAAFQFAENEIKTLLAHFPSEKRSKSKDMNLLEHL